MDFRKVGQGNNLKDEEIFSVSKYIEILNARIWKNGVKSIFLSNSAFAQKAKAGAILAKRL